MDTDADGPGWLVTAALALGVCVLAALVFRYIPDLPDDDDARPVWIGTCGGISYRWHYDPRTVPSGASCVVETVLQR